ncbi:helix-turn-helix domain-containing protein [Paenibacillus sp. LPE1-1-1.1]|uniref:helix-turn-helix domain-containing protein n=1 Tax=Paenibacillus sp. LPE1-1-1.1 TaxID=3135230 RepID=UPI003422C8E0
MIDIKRVGEIIATNRKELAMTQIQLGDILNVSHQAVSKWERGECLPDIDILVQLAKFFNKTVDQLLVQEENGNATTKMIQNNDFNDIWDSVLKIIKNKISQPSFDQWFSNTTAVHIGDSLIISGHDTFATDWLYRRYSSLILKAVDHIRGDRELEITFRFSEGSNNKERITIER